MHVISRHTDKELISVIDIKTVNIFSLEKYLQLEHDFHVLQNSPSSCYSYLSVYSEICINISLW